VYNVSKVKKKRSLYQCKIVPIRILTCVFKHTRLQVNKIFFQWYLIISSVSRLFYIFYFTLMVNVNI